MGGEETRPSIEDRPGWLLLARLWEVCLALGTAGRRRRIGEVEVYGFREEAIVKLISIVSNALPAYYTVWYAWILDNKNKKKHAQFMGKWGYKLLL